MSTRPRPRPKPRARVQSSAPPSSPGPSSNSLPPVRKAKTPIVIDDEDEDALFIRKPRTVDAWRKLDRIAEDKPKDKVINLDSSDEEHKTSSSPARKNKKSMMKPRVRQSSNSSLPAWTRDEDALQSSSSESDDELLDFIVPPICGSKRSSREPERRQRKRQRSRSKSLTPPPAVPADKIKDARERVRRMLNEGREPLPTTTFPGR
ncbi:hypothetical protein QCA50_006942 [Cerrena zonata]|uniref:Uncharacterized protein n=1 Tax=Cerrena zonata TaxID=2478898 RepID=A0AAW0GF69_9APHY